VLSSITADHTTTRASRRKYAFVSKVSAKVNVKFSVCHSRQTNTVTDCTMTVWLGLPGVRILQRRFWIPHSRTVMPVNSVFRAASILMKCDITTRSDTSSKFCSRVFSTLRCHDKSRDQERQITDDKPVALPLLVDTYNELMTAPKWLTHEEWSAVGGKFRQGKFLSSIWPTVMLNFIAQKTAAVPGLYNVGMSLVDYISSLSDRHQLLRLVSAIAICIHQGGESHHKEALALYDELCSEYDMLDHRSASTLITALAKTRRWRRCMELINMMKIAAEPTSKEYSPIIVAALINQDDQLANDLLATLSKNGLVPQDEVFMCLLSNGAAERVLTVLKTFGWIPSKPVIDSVITEIQRYNAAVSVS